MKCLMSTLSLVLLLVAVSTAQKPGGPGGPGGRGGHGPKSGEHRACRTALKPADTEIQASKDATTVCIAEQDGLDAIIATLKGKRGGDNDGDGPGRHSRHGGPPNGGPGHHSLAERLEKNQYDTQATTLRECIARETGRLNSDGTFNDEALQTELKAKVSGATVEENTLKGITNCGTVLEYDTSDYMECIRSYCATGSFTPRAEEV